MPPGRLNRPGWRLVGAAALAGLLYVGTSPLLRQLDFFRVRQIELRGVVNLAPATVIEAMDLRPDANVFDPQGPLLARLGAMPGLLSVDVGRRIPGTLVVTVAETPAVALVPRGARLELVGEDGAVLPFDPTVAGPDLPVVGAADSLATRLLGRLRESDATFFGQVTEAEQVGGDVVLRAGGHRYWFRPDAPAEVFEAVQRVTQDLAKRARPWAAIDARFSGMIVVRWGEG